MPSPGPTEENRKRGAALKAVRRRQGLTQREAALRADMADETYAQREQGRIAISPIEVPGLAAALGVQSEVLAREIEIATAARQAEAAAYETAAHVPRTAREQRPPPLHLHAALAELFPFGLVDVVAQAIIDVSRLQASDQQVTIEAIQDLVEGRALRSGQKRRVRYSGRTREG